MSVNLLGVEKPLQLTLDYIDDNQAAKVGQYVWMGQLTCSNRRRQGTLHGITAPA